MNQYAKLYKLKDSAKDRLCGSYTDTVFGCFLFFLVLVGAFLIPVLFPALAAMLTGVFSFRAFYTASVQTGLIFCLILTGFFKLGISYLCFRIACGQSCRYENIFYGFSGEILGKALFLSTLHLLVGILFQLPFLYLFLQYINSADYRMLIAALLASAAGYLIYVPIGLTFDIAYYLLLDFPEKRLGALLDATLHVIHGHRRRFFLLRISFLPLYLLCILSLGVGFLWICPYAHMTQVLFYLDLMKS
ncbi:MAG: DUF975 family protein [bacterium]|nr:DUF975 family protein [bacterium]